MADLNVISQKQVQQLEDAKALIPGLKAEIRRAKQAGIDVGEMEKELAEQETLINGMLRVYGTS